MKKMGNIGIIITLLLLVVTAIVLLSLSFKKLKSTEVGLEYNRVNKVLDDAAKNGGLHLGPPGFRFIKFPSTFISAELPSGTCVSQDGLRVDFRVSFQYQMPAEWLPFAVIRYRDFRKWDEIVRAAGESAVQHSCALFEISDFQNKRGIIQDTMLDNLRLKLEGPPGSINGEGGVYVRAVTVQLNNLEVPNAYKNAISNRQSAEEDISLAINQRRQALIQANSTLLAAEEDAKRIKDTATNEAEVLLKEAELKAEETQFIYEKEAETLLNIKNALDLSSEGLLSYMSNKLYEEAPRLKASMMEPADTSFSLAGEL